VYLTPTFEELDAMVANIATGGDPDQLYTGDNSGGVLYTTLTIALNQNRPDTARWLIHRGASVNIPIERGLTPMGMALHREDREMVRLLLDHGADANAASHGYSPLQTAAGYDLVGIAALLLEFGANLEGRDGTGSTALMLAAINGRTHMARFLLRQGADVNALNNEDWTALMGAVSKGNVEMARLLLENGADAHLGPAGLPGRPLDFARRLGDAPMIALLDGYGAGNRTTTS